ncbi:saccharopine dehydrogenase NADP-binding domain-containing protein [Phycicoccus sp.]|uniref:saccharopine dehydrogenase family protein n=1 Tax=Phycicoccus sp. TaxID=1902410 RepID=UPI002CE4D9DA|nr:saccharopine dehydrogenase NADP-binding domain-containing protein [Phycicoccus sp.]HMM96487.1 saccharopine dehydrogenase NADP-binding domain-containing protein [Phycicoccus sp.]
MTDAARELDIVLFGATGFVGRLTAHHLAEHAPGEVRIGLAGRSRERLGEVRRGLGERAAEWPLLVLDALDEDAVADLAARTRVVVTTVGPYAKFGMPLAAACAEAGTHYCDLTGEVLFVHRSVGRNHEPAMLSGARVVHACGFDSIPSDLGVMLCADAARADGAELGRTRLAVRSMKGGFSGGTIDSARTQALEMRADPSTRRIAADPWALAEGGRPPRTGGAGSPRPGGVAGVLDRAVKASPVRRDPDNGHFTGPFVMAAFNTRIVARSASLLHYGKGFRYTEYSDYGAGPRGAVTASVVSAGLLGAVAGMAFGPTRAVLDRVLPAPGEGPSEEAMASGRFRMEVMAEASNGARYRSVVAAPYDPGYSGTAVMLGQAALALAESNAGLPDSSGVLTPATGIGPPLVERLRAHGFTLEVERLP